MTEWTFQPLPNITYRYKDGILTLHDVAWGRTTEVFASCLVQHDKPLYQDRPWSNPKGWIRTDHPEPQSGDRVFFLREGHLNFSGRKA